VHSRAQVEVQYNGSSCSVLGRKPVTKIKGILTKSYVKGGEEEEESYEGEEGRQVRYK
jgi:hypothetical protein